MTLPITIGDLRHRVQIEVAGRASDGGGGAVLTWTMVAEVSAAIWTRTSDEAFEHDRTAGRATHDIWIRHRAGVMPAMRFRFGTRTFDILGVIDPDDRGRWLRCPVLERNL